jgi:hypothetical protein
LKNVAYRESSLTKKAISWHAEPNNARNARSGVNAYAHTNRYAGQMGYFKFTAFMKQFQSHCGDFSRMFDAVALR